MSHKSRFRVESSDGKTRVIDLSTGEDITRLCAKVVFIHDAHDGLPRIELTLISYEPDIVVTSPVPIDASPSPDRKLGPQSVR
jgi:hypothetical protein